MCPFVCVFVCVSCDTRERREPYRLNEGPHTPTNSDEISQRSTNSWLSSPAVWKFTFKRSGTLSETTVPSKHPLAQHTHHRVLIEAVTTLQIKVLLPLCCCCSQNEYAHLLTAVPVCREAALWPRAPLSAREEHVPFCERGWSASEFPAPGVVSWALAGVEGSYNHPPLCPLSAPQRQITLPKHWAPQSPCWFFAL